MCGASGVVQRLYTHHITPRAQGGSDAVSNLMLVCQSCHMKLEREAAAAVRPREVQPPAPWLRPGIDGGWQPCSQDWGGECIPNPAAAGGDAGPEAA